MGNYRSDSDDDSNSRKKKKRRSRSGSRSSGSSRTRRSKNKSKKSKKRSSRSVSRSRSRSPSKYKSSSRTISPRRRSKSPRRSSRRSRTRSPRSSRRSRSPRNARRSRSKSPRSSRRSRSGSPRRGSRRSRSPDYRRSRSLDRRRSRSRSRSKRSSKSDSGARVEPGKLVLPAQQAEMKLQQALRAAALADERLKEAGLLPDGIGRSAQELRDSHDMGISRAAALEAIEDEGFSPAQFMSSRTSKDKVGSAAASHENAIFSNLPLDLGDIDPAAILRAGPMDPREIMHPNLLITAEEKMERWRKKLLAMRNKKLEGEAM